MNRELASEGPAVAGTPATPARLPERRRNGVCTQAALGGRSRAGHTLVELLVVVLVLSVIARFAMPRLNYVSLRVDGNSRIVRSVLQQAWRLSIQTQHDVLVRFDTAGRTMETIEDTNGDDLPTAGERTTRRPLEEGVLFDTPATSIGGYATQQVTGPGLKTIGGLPTVIFRRNGSTSGDIEVYLSARNRTNKEWRAITLTQSTGRTDWYRLVNNAWRSGGI